MAVSEPLAYAAPPAAAAWRSPGLASAGTPVRILVSGRSERPLGELLNAEDVRGAQTASAAEAVELARKVPPDAFVFGLEPRASDVVAACTEARSFSEAFVIVLDPGDETTRLVAFSAGADDVVPPGVTPRELRARIAAMFRRGRSRETAPATIEIGDLVIDPRLREVRVGDELVELSRVEFDVLQALAENRSLALSRPQLLERVWGPSWFGDDHVIDVHISNLRRKLGDSARSPRFVRTVRGYGFRMVAPAASRQR
jgi:DNA-binding response OmpR family regulator